MAKSNKTDALHSIKVSKVQKEWLDAKSLQTGDPISVIIRGLITKEMGSE